MGVESCPYHPNEIAGFKCSGCHRCFCHRCVSEVSGRSYCGVCKASLVRRQVRLERLRLYFGDMTGAGLRLVACGIPFTLALSVYGFTGGRPDLLILVFFVFSGGIGALLFLIGVISTKADIRPLPAVLVGTVYLVCACGLVAKWLEGDSSIGWLLFLLYPGLLLLVTGLAVLALRSSKKGRSFG
ncbi:B-box zinc finger protein [Chloroflexota bacterium]